MVWATTVAAVQVSYHSELVTGVAVLRDVRTTTLPRMSIVCVVVLLARVQLSLWTSLSLRQWALLHLTSAWAQDQWQARLAQLHMVLVRTTLLLVLLLLSLPTNSTECLPVWLLQVVVSLKWAACSPAMLQVQCPILHLVTLLLRQLSLVLPTLNFKAKAKTVSTARTQAPIPLLSCPVVLAI